MPAKIRIQWNAGTTGVSGCVLKTLACRGLRVGPSKFQNLLSDNYKARLWGQRISFGPLEGTFHHRHKRNLYLNHHRPHPIEKGTMRHKNITYPKKSTRIIFEITVNRFEPFRINFEKNPQYPLYLCELHDITRLRPLSLSNSFLITVTRFEKIRINWVMFSWQMVLFSGPDEWGRGGQAVFETTFSWRPGFNLF